MRFRISAWGIRNPIPVALIFLALSIAGAFSYARLPIKQFPNVTFPIVTVTVTQNGAAPSEVETQITRPVEDAVASVSNVKHITSNVTLGASVTSIQFELGSDMQKATDDIRTAVERVRVNLPAGIDPPTVQRLDVDAAPIVTYAVSSPTMSPAELSWFVDNTVARALQGQSGVAQVVRVGGVDREINVILDPDRMAARGVTAAQINDALRSFNEDAPGGRANIGAREQTIRVLGQATTVQALRDTTIPVGQGFVRLSDVAEVGDGQAEVRGFARLNGRPAVAFQVNKTRDSSDVRTEDRVRAAVAKLAADHPDVRFELVVSTVTETRQSFHATLEVLIEGMLLAALVVWLFLRNWRATLIAAVAMPLSLIPTFWVISLLGFSLNVITLLALTLVIGILVDDAIVEIENIEKRIERGQTPYRAALIGADSIGLAVVATTFTIVVVFTPVSFMGGISGQFFREFGLTVAVSVLFSLAVARLVTPLMAAYFLKPAANPKPAKPLTGPYRRALDWALAHKWLSALIGGLFFVGSVILAISLPVGFQPRSNPAYVYLNLEGPPGATPADMERAVQRVTALLLRQPDASAVFAQVGASSGGGFGAAASGGDLRSGTLTVVLKQNRSMSADQFRAATRPLLRSIPDVRITTRSDFGSSDVNIVLSSENGPLLERTRAQLMTEMRGLREVSDPRPSPPAPGPELIIRPKPDEAARLGVNALALSSVVRVATIGDIDPNVAKFSEGERRIPIRARLPERARTDLQTLANLQVPTTSGKTTALSTVADIGFESGPGTIVRYDRKRQAAIDADFANGAILGSANAAISKLPTMKKILAGQIPGVSRANAGDTEALIDLMTNFLAALFSGIALIYAVLVLLFRSFFKPATILSALPLSIGGAFLLLLLTGQAVTMPVLIGCLMLFGIAAKNSILLVEFAIEDQRAGQSLHDALINACRERARPIIMTTVAMMAGMLPTALGLGQGSEFRQPMAIAVIGGLLSSTALSLVLVPVVYEFVDGFEGGLKPKLARLITPKQPGDDAPIAEGEESVVTSGAS